MYDLSILIVNWNTRELLRQCLLSASGTGCSLKLETVVVDNNSSDHSAEMVLREFPTVRLIRNEVNLGFAKACNQAMRAATGRYLLLLNSDTQILEGALDAMCRYMDENEQVAAVGCTLLSSDGSVQRSYWNRFPSVRDALIENLYLYRLSHQRQYPREGNTAGSSPTEEAIDVCHLLGACVMLRREAVADVGLFDEGYFMYLEETDWFYRAKRKGWRVCHLPSVRVIHHGQQSSQLDPVRVIPHLSKSYCRFVRKHYGGGSTGAIKAIYACGAVIRVLLWTKRRLAGPDRRLAGRMLSAYGAVVREICRA